jgi:FkbM family methyltransferase
MRKLHWSVLKRLYRLGNRFSVHSRQGREWLLDNRNWVDQQLIIRRPYEVKQLQRCRSLVREHTLEMFFDIGANFGLYSVLLADEAGLSEIHAFEPLPRNAYQLGANLFLNNLDQRVRIHNLALSDREGMLDFYVDPHSTGVSTLYPVETRDRSGVYQTMLQVPAAPFDGLFVLAGKRCLMKIDVEGAELQVLAGMRRFLANNSLAMQIETTPKTRDAVITFMEQAGFGHLGELGADAYFSNL